jgi:hypothetical protein
MRTRHLPLLLSITALTLATPGCDTDDAAKSDAKDAQHELDKAAGQNDEKAKNEAEDAIEDVDGK